MRLRSLTTVTCFLFVFVHQYSCTNILKKIKDFLHPTTTTTTVRPTLSYHEYGFENRTIVVSSTTPAWMKIPKNPIRDRPNSSSKEDSSSEEDSTARSPYSFDEERRKERPLKPENFPTIAPHDVNEIYPGMKTATTRKPTDFKFNMTSTQKSYFDEDASLEITTKYSTTESSYNDINPGMKKISTTLKPSDFKFQVTSTQNSFYENDASLYLTTKYSTTESSYYEIYPGMKKTTTRKPPDFKFQVTSTQKSLFDNDPNLDITTKYSTTESSYNNFQTDGFNNNEITGFQPQTTTFKSNDVNYLTTDRPKQQETSTPSYEYTIDIRKPEESSSNNQNQPTEEDSIVFPDDPCLNSVAQGEVAASCGGGGLRVATGAPVPVGEDGGRNIASVPSKDCGKGRKMDNNGKCRPIARK